MQMFLLDSFHEIKWPFLFPFFETNWTFLSDSSLLSPQNWIFLYLSLFPLQKGDNRLAFWSLSSFWVHVWVCRSSSRWRSRRERLRLRNIIVNNKRSIIILTLKNKSKSSLWNAKQKYIYTIWEDWELQSCEPLPFPGHLKHGVVKAYFIEARHHQNLSFTVKVAASYAIPRNMQSTIAITKNGFKNVWNHRVSPSSQTEIAKNCYNVRASSLMVVPFFRHDE